MNWYYLALDLASLSIPFILSFTVWHRLGGRYPHFILGIVATAIPFLVWDVLFTRMGVWGFNHDYLIGWSLFDLPLEEWLFFFAIPFACLFVYDRLDQLTNIHFNTQWADALVIIASVAVLMLGLPGWYSGSVAGSVILFMLLKWYLGVRNDSSFYIAYLIVTVPFILVNGALTGMFTPEPVVWYNDMENCGVRLITIPIEDFLYYYLMFGMNHAIYEWSKKRLR